MQRTERLPRASDSSGADVMTWVGNSLAIILAALAVASGVIGMLVAFDQIGNAGQPFEDGMMWLLGGVILALAANVFRREHHIVRVGDATASAMSTANVKTSADNHRERGEGQSRARDLKDMTGMTVVATDEARNVGTVKEVIFDPGEMAIMAFVVSPPGSREGRMFVGREHVRGLGRDAVTIQSEDNLQAFATKGREREYADAGVHLEGLRVTTDQGDDVGKVSRVLITGDCRIARLEAGGGIFGRSRRIDAGDIVSIGNERIIVSRSDR